MRIQLMFVIVAVCLASCGTSNDAEATAIATAAVANAENGENAATPTVSDAGSDMATATPDAAAATLDPTQPDGVSQSFFAAYQSDPAGDASAVYFTEGMTKLYNSGKTVTDITGIDPTYTSATVIDTQLYNDNKNAIVTVQLDYANGSQKVDVTLELQNAQWRVASIAAQPQK